MAYACNSGVVHLALSRILRFDLQRSCGCKIEGRLIAVVAYERSRTHFHFDLIDCSVQMC